MYSRGALVIFQDSGNAEASPCPLAPVGAVFTPDGALPGLGSASDSGFGDGVDPHPYSQFHFHLPHVWHLTPNSNQSQFETLLRPPFQAGLNRRVFVRTAPFARLRVVVDSHPTAYLHRGVIPRRSALAYGGFELSVEVRGDVVVY
ncbi:hypothetical protein PENCOP_c012G03779 [Penicillium coprophilum]|uniref:Uncharacterized protein n=1 Tax=Penicillium coprophilum TaxID=36646 RepID=A0A1V6UDA1_9EURO|nr:hypothetical protein PENCOP_c012G03779 [Penicillium coprophilum]